jgi:hypothetical protein
MLKDVHCVGRQFDHTLPNAQAVRVARAADSLSYGLARWSWPHASNSNALPSAIS